VPRPDADSRYFTQHTAAAAARAWRPIFLAAATCRAAAPPATPPRPHRSSPRPETRGKPRAAGNVPLKRARRSLRRSRLSPEAGPGLLARALLALLAQQPLLPRPEVLLGRLRLPRHRPASVKLSGTSSLSFARDGLSEPRIRCLRCKKKGANGRGLCECGPSAV